MLWQKSKVDLVQFVILKAVQKVFLMMLKSAQKNPNLVGWLCFALFLAQIVLLGWMNGDNSLAKAVIPEGEPDGFLMIIWGGSMLLSWCSAVICVNSIAFIWAMLGSLRGDDGGETVGAIAMIAGFLAFLNFFSWFAPGIDFRYVWELVIVQIYCLSLLLCLFSWMGAFDEDEEDAALTKKLNKLARCC